MLTSSGGAWPPPFVAAFESTYLPLHDRDVMEATGHDTRFDEDVAHALGAGVRTFRYPLRWHRIEAEPGVYDWSGADRALGRLAEAGADVVLDLVHHTSYPRWLDEAFRDRRFGDAYVRFAEAAAQRYDVAGYTLFNEPFATLFLAGHEALWPPYDLGNEGFVRLLRSVLPAIGRAGEIWTEARPGARHVYVDTCEHHRGQGAAAERHARLANDRRHVVLDLLLGHDLDPGRPFLRELIEAGGEHLLQLPPVRVDVLGLDYYPHSEWWYDETGARAPSPHPAGFAALAEHYAGRYGLPVMLGETNIRGVPEDRAAWLRHMLEQFALAVSRGVPLTAFCWFPHVDSCDWDSLLARPAGRADPVGVLGLDRERTVFTAAWEAAARGTPPAGLPAHPFSAPNAEDLAGWAPWFTGRRNEPADVTNVTNVTDLTDPTDLSLEDSVPDALSDNDLVVLSHLRWVWVWQRPQHLVSRLARTRAAAGSRTWFVEEPVVDPGVERPEVRHADVGDGVTRVWLALPAGTPVDPGFDAPGAEHYGELLVELLAREGRPPSPDVLLWTPMADELATALAPRRTGYDVMDDLASFTDAPRGLVLRHHRLLARADVVFAGGRSLRRSVAQRRPDAHLFASGVETAHWAASRALRRPRERLVAGYVGVIDERLDLDLVARLAAELPDWTIRMVGPVTKIDPAAVPQAPNLEYPGLVRYQDLPAVMAGFDVALMPFALTEATRSISPTKTLEYLAAGLPVVSTRVPDVVADVGEVVRLADPETFAAACLHVLDGLPPRQSRVVQRLLVRREWDAIAAAMGALLAGTAAAAAEGVTA